MTSRGADGRRPIRMWWLLPFLVAAFPVLFLFGENINEQLSLEPLWVPLAVVLGGAAALLVLALAIGRVFGIEAVRMALVASVLLGLALTYGHAWNLLGEALGLHRLLLAVWGAIGLAAIVLILVVSRDVIARLTPALTVMLTILVLVNLVPIAGLAMRTIGAEMAAGADRRGSGSTPSTGRDVWYLVFDRYAGAPTLALQYGYDNTPFLDDLRDRGFVVAEGATANYLKTAPSLASSLNMTELDPEALAAEAVATDDWTPLYRALQGSHAVERFLHEQGYRYIHLGLRRGATYANGAADITLVSGGTTEFSAVLADTTILAALESFVPPEVALGTEELYASQTLYQLDELERLADLPGRNFVFGHLLLPHPPYLFNADGSRVTDQQRLGRTSEEAYVEQLRFANARIVGLLDRMLDVPEADRPIVVLAADEGPFPERYAADEAGFAWLEATDEELLRKFSILMAVLVPGTDERGLAEAGFSDTMTPTNLFRVVFNAAFDAGLAPITDRNWIFTDQRHLYDLVDITDRVREVVAEARRAVAP